jgi:hypothetical protein
MEEATVHLGRNRLAQFENRGGEIPWQLAGDEGPGRALERCFKVGNPIWGVGGRKLLTRIGSSTMVRLSEEESSVTSRRRGQWCRWTGRWAMRCRGGAGGVGGNCGEWLEGAIIDEVSVLEGKPTMTGLSGPSMKQLWHRMRAPTSATGDGELVDGSRRSNGAKRRGKAEAIEELRVGKIKWALPSRRCSQRIRVNDDRGGARGGSAAWAVRGGRCKHLGPGRYVSVINDNH